MIIWAIQTNSIWASLNTTNYIGYPATHAFNPETNRTLCGRSFNSFNRVIEGQREKTKSKEIDFVNCVICKRKIDNSLITAVSEDDNE